MAIRWVSVLGYPMSGHSQSALLETRGCLTIYGDQTSSQFSGVCDACGVGDFTLSIRGCSHRCFYLRCTVTCQVVNKWAIVSRKVIYDIENNRGWFPNTTDFIWSWLETSKDKGKMRRRWRKLGGLLAMEGGFLWAAICCDTPPASGGDPTALAGGMGLGAGANDACLTWNQTQNSEQVINVEPVHGEFIQTDGLHAGDGRTSVDNDMLPRILVIVHQACVYQLSYVLCVTHAGAYFSIYISGILGLLRVYVAIGEAWCRLWIPTGGYTLASHE